MSVIVVVTAEGAVVNIHMLGAISEGILTLWVFQFSMSIRQKC